jgi:hypothetical protein
MFSNWVADKILALYADDYGFYINILPSLPQEITGSCWWSQAYSYWSKGI